MDTLRRRYLLVIVALALASPLALYLQYDVPAAQGLEELKRKVPTQMGDWCMVPGAERGPTEDEKRILETDAVLTRTYTRGSGPQCDLSITFSRDNRRVAHPPEICYKGGGWSVEANELVSFLVEGRAFYANRLLLFRGGTRLHVLYWFRAGQADSASYLRMQWNIIKLQFTRRGSSSALLRVSAISSSPDEDRAVLAALRDFAAAVIPAVSKAVE